jgi:hypothetical protein
MSLVHCYLVLFIVVHLAESSQESGRMLHSCTRDGKIIEMEKSSNFRWPDLHIGTDYVVQGVKTHDSAAMCTVERSDLKWQD